MTKKKEIMATITIPSSTTSEKRAFIEELLDEAGSKFVSITFVKKDGSLRTMNIQKEVGKFHVKGEDASESAKKAVITRKLNNPNLMSLWDAQKQEFRSVNIATMTEARFNKIQYIFKQ